MQPADACCLSADAPDYGTPISETLEAANTLYNEGKFKRFGISNYCAKDVEEFCDLADKHGWVKPSAYQVRALPLFPLSRPHASQLTPSGV